MPPGAADLEAALTEELARAAPHRPRWSVLGARPVGALQCVLARRVAVAVSPRACRPHRDELFEERRSADGGLGLALIRDGNGPRSFETLLRYRGAAIAEFWRALRTLKALQAEQATTELQEAALAPLPSIRPAVRPQAARHAEPNEPERIAARCLAYLQPEPPTPGRPARARGRLAPNEPESGAVPHASARREHAVRPPCTTPRGPDRRA